MQADKIKTEDLQERELFGNKRIRLLLMPLILEQVFTVSVAFLDTVMVSAIGETALSAISLVDGISQLFIQIFVAIGGGASIVAAQYIGKRDRKAALATANLTVAMMLVLSSLISVLACVFRAPLLGAVYPNVSERVMGYANQYMLLSALSYPVFALYNAGVSLLYAQGNSRASLFAAVVMNVVKILGNFLLIKVFHLEVVGAGAATILSRLSGAVVVTLLLLNRESFVHYSLPGRLPKGAQKKEGVLPLVRRIFQVAIPSGVENFLFLFGKMIIGTVVAALPSYMIAAHAAANAVSGFVNIPGNAINLAMVTVVGQCVGASSRSQAKENTRKMLKVSYITQGFMCILLLFSTEAVLSVMSLSKEAFTTTSEVLRVYALMSIFFLTPAFGLPNALRAAGDSKFTMYVSIGTVFLVRVLFSYILVGVFKLGLHGVWIAMYMDWLVRDTLFYRRFRGGKWLEHSLVQGA